MTGPWTREGDTTLELENDIGTIAQTYESPDQVEAPTQPSTTHSGESPSGKTSFLAPLRLANFRKLVAGQTVSRLGDAFYFVALPWLVLRSTSSPIYLSVVLGVAAATLGISTLFGGVLADRYGPRALMLGADIARFIIIATMAGWALFSTMPLWAVITLAGLLGIATGLFYPASSAMTPHLVQADDLQAANSFNQITMQASNFIGPGIAGAVLGATQLAFGFVLDAASFAVSVISLLAIRMPPPSTTTTSISDSVAAPTSPLAQPQDKPRDSGLAALGEALRFVRVRPFLFTAMGLTLLTNFAVNGLFEVGLPLLLKHWVGLVEGPRALGFIIGGFGLGSIVGAVIAGVSGRLPHKALLSVLMLLPCAALFAWIPYTHDVYLATGVFAVTGLFIGYINVVWITLIQRGIPMDMLGRVMSLALLGSFVGTPLSIFAYGALATVVPDISLLFLAGAALFGLAGLFALSQKSVREAE